MLLVLMALPFDANANAAAPPAKARVHIGRVECVRMEGERSIYAAEARVLETLHGKIDDKITIRFAVHPGRATVRFYPGDQAVVILHPQDQHWVVRSPKDKEGLVNAGGSLPPCPFSARF